MTAEQTKKILARASEIEGEITKLKGVRLELAKSGTASASMSSGGGSRSYTRLDLGKITEAIQALQKELSQLRVLLSGGNPLSGKIYRVYC